MLLFSDESDFAFIQAWQGVGEERDSALCSDKESAFINDSISLVG